MEDLERRLREAATNTSLAYPVDLLVEASRAIGQLKAAGFIKRDQGVQTDRMFIDGTWLVEITAECTCGAGSGKRHNSLCGVQSIVDLTTIPGFEEMIEDVRN